MASSLTWRHYRYRVVGTIPSAFVIGERTISRNPIASEDHRWEGTIANDGYKGRVWRDGTIEGVIKQLDRDLGPVEEAAYVIQE